MNDHLYKKLRKLFMARKNGPNDLDEYRRALVSHKVTEAALIEEIGRRVKG